MKVNNSGIMALMGYNELPDILKTVLSLRGCVQRGKPVASALSLGDEAGEIAEGAG